jgi:hypothetical protein
MRRPHWAAVAAAAIALCMTAPGIYCGERDSGNRGPIIESGLYRALRIDSVHPFGGPVSSSYPALTAYCPAGGRRCRPRIAASNLSSLPVGQRVRMATGVPLDRFTVYEIPQGQEGAVLRNETARVRLETKVDATARDETGQRWAVKLPVDRNLGGYELRLYPSGGKGGFLSFVVIG